MLPQSNSGVVISVWWGIRWFLFSFCYFSRNSARNMNYFYCQKAKKNKRLHFWHYQAQSPRLSTCSLPLKALLAPFYRWAGWVSGTWDPRHEDLEMGPGLRNPAHTSSPRPPIPEASSSHFIQGCPCLPKGRSLPRKKDYEELPLFPSNGPKVVCLGETRPRGR